MTESAPFTQVQDLSAAFVRLVGIAAPGIVTVQSHRSRSSGFLWRPGLIITADDALSEEGDVAVTLPGGESIAARLVGRDHTTDIAVLRVDRSDLPPIRLEAPPVPVGALALAVGAEDGAPTAAFGVVSRSTGPWWSLRSGEIDARIELDLRMRQSAEGGLAISGCSVTYDTSTRARVMGSYWDYDDRLCGCDFVPPAATATQRSTALWRQDPSGRDLYGQG